MSKLQRFSLKLTLMLSIIVFFSVAVSAQEKGENETLVTQEQKNITETDSTPDPTAVDTPEKTPVENEPQISAPINYLKQQQNDIKHYLEPSIIKPMLVDTTEHVTLVESNTTSIAKGVMILLPDWQQSAISSKAINYLRLNLPKQGWTTITIQPPNKPEKYPSHETDRVKRIENNQKSLTKYQNNLWSLLEKVHSKAKEYPGIIVVISEGSNGAILSNIYQQQTANMPNAFILLSGFLPTLEDNKTVAASISQLPFPVLDLTLFSDNRYVEAAAQLRSDKVKQEMKPFYRQKQLHNTTPSYYPNTLLNKEINGWLASIGW